jgi:hypothetical protein
MMPVQAAPTGGGPWQRDDNKITTDISTHLRLCCRDDSSFEFCWHEHALMKARVQSSCGKRTVPFYHVKVSWTRRKGGFKDPLRFGVDSQGLVRLAPLYPFIECGQKPDISAVSASSGVVASLYNAWSSGYELMLSTLFHFASRALEHPASPHFPVLRSARPVFTPNPFPYQMDTGHHSILWYFSKERCVSENQIEQDIILSIQEEHQTLHQTSLSNEEFVFRWYENPKMSHPNFYHVQVFWALKGEY